MFGKFYVGHEVIMRKRFVKFKYASNSMSCRVANNFFVSRKCVLLRRDNDGNYIYSNNQQKCIVLDPNNLQVIDSILTCNQCNKRKNNSMDCDLSSDTPVEFVGVVDIQPIQSFAKTTDLNLAIYLVNDYNSKIDDRENYVYVDDFSYIDTIREIDDGIGRKRVRSVVE